MIVEKGGESTRRDGSGRRKSSVESLGRKGENGPSFIGIWEVSLWVLDWDEQAGLTVELGGQPGILTDRLRLAKSPESPVAGLSLVAFQKVHCASPLSRLELVCKTSRGICDKTEARRIAGRFKKEKGRSFIKKIFFL